MDAKWEAAIDLTLRRLVYGSLAGGAAGLVLFRASPRRARPLASRRLASPNDRSLARSRAHTGSHTTASAMWTPILKDFCRRFSSPRVPRFQSPTSTPFNSASDAFQLHPDVRSHRSRAHVLIPNPPPPPTHSVRPSGGGGARASSLAFGAGAALGSAYTGASPRRPSSSVAAHLAGVSLPSRFSTSKLLSRRRFADAPPTRASRARLRRLLAAVREPRVPEAPARAQVSRTSRENSGAMTASHSTCKQSIPLDDAPRRSSAARASASVLNKIMEPSFHLRRRPHCFRAHRVRRRAHPRWRPRATPSSSPGTSVFSRSSRRARKRRGRRRI